MTGSIIEAICKELQKLFEGTGTQVMRDTQASPENLGLNSINLVILSIGDSPDQYQGIGGATWADWDLTIRAFFYDENSLLEDDQQFNTAAYDLIDTIRKHIALEDWLTSEMADAAVLYCFKLTLNGIVKSTEMQKTSGGIVPGFAINYNTIAFDDSTTWITNTDFLTRKIEGITIPDLDLTDNYQWLEDVITFLTNVTAYTGMTTGSVGDRYYIQSVKKIYTILTLNPTTHKPATSNIYSPIENDIFIAADNSNYAWIWDGSNIQQHDMITQETD